MSPVNIFPASSTSPKRSAVDSGQLQCNERTLGSASTRQLPWQGQCSPMYTDLCLELLPTEQKRRYVHLGGSRSVCHSLHYIASRLRKANLRGFNTVRSLWR